MLHANCLPFQNVCWHFYPACKELINFSQKKKKKTKKEKLGKGKAGNRITSTNTHLKQNRKKKSIYNKFNATYGTSSWKTTKYLSQRITKPTIRPMWPAKTQLSLHIHPVQARVHRLSLFCSPEAVEDTWSAKTDQTTQMCRLIWVFAGHTSLIVGFVLHWLKFYKKKKKFVFKIQLVSSSF